MLPALALASSLGLRGQGLPLLVPLSLSLNGNTVTFATALADAVRAEECAGDAAPCAARPVGHQRAGEAVRDEDRRPVTPRDGVLEGLTPFVERRVEPVSLDHAPVRRIGGLPAALPVPGAGVAVAGQHEDRRRRHAHRACRALIGRTAA